MKSPALKVLFVGAELEPLVKVGGLGDVMGSLPRALAKLGAEVKIVIPFYGGIDSHKYKIALFKKNIIIDLGGSQTHFDLYKTKLPDSSPAVDVWLVKHKLFDAKQIYLGSRRYFKGGVYSRKTGDIARFVFLSKAAVEIIRQLAWKPDIVHGHDWHSALVPTFIDEYSLKYKDFPNINTLFTIHNLANQGIASLDIVDYASLHHDLTPALMEDYFDKDGNVIDLIKIGILSADYINTVSPTYAREILSKQYGEGLEKYLQRRKKHLAGILNGIDWKLFNPAHDKLIKKTYNIKTVVSGKAINKQWLQKKLGLPQLKNIPVFGLVSRLVKQKGLDILLPALGKFLRSNKLQIVVLGTGQAEYEQGLRALAKKYPRQAAVNIKFNIKLAQQIYAGSDFFLMPSQFEPCGLGQMIAQRYGTVPIARQTGGLRDTVTNNKTGLLFKKYQTGQLARVIERALKFYSNKNKFMVMATRIMKLDHSWSASAKKYVQLYKKLV